MVKPDLEVENMQCIIRNETPTPNRTRMDFSESLLFCSNSNHLELVKDKKKEKELIKL